MPNQKKQPRRPTSPLLSPTPQRPQTIRRRISSGFNTFLSNLPLRRSAPQQNPNPRPQTVPNPDRVVVTWAGRTPASQQAPIPQIRIPLISDLEEPCPYDATKYQSFPSIERSRCSFCGLRATSKAKPSSPCNDCRSKSPFSHLKFPRQRKSGLGPNEGTRSEGFTPRPQHSPSSSEDMIRIVPPHIAAKRIGNPPRTASMPTGVSRLGATNTRRSPAPTRPPNPSPAAGTVKHRRDVSSNTEVRPLSPKLHYLHGLPNSKAYPYVRKSEVVQHMAAIAAGSPSPLTDVARAARPKNCDRDTSRDFSETVFYGKNYAPGFTVQKEPLEPRLPTPRVSQPGTIVVEEGRVVVGRPGSAQAGSRLGGGDGPVQRPPPSRAKSTGLRLRGGEDGEVIPRLRGGSGGDSSQRSCSFLLKQCLLTCSYQETGPSSSDDDLPPPRTPDAAVIARALRRASGTARLPKNIQRHSLKKDETCRQQDTHINQPFLFSEPRDTTPSLRGGAASPSALRDHERLPAGLFWLAGGRGKPITAAAWKAQKPKKRMGGLVGVALYGTKTGREYKAAEKATEKEAVHEKAASLAGSAQERAESVKSSKTHSSKSSTKSRSAKSSSGSSSRSSKSSKSSADAAEEGEGKRDVLLDAVPEEAVPEEAAPAPQDGTAAEDPPVEASAGGAVADEAPQSGAAAAAASDGNAAEEGR